MSKALIKKQPLNTPQVAVAACSMALPESGSREIQLTPTGEFRSFDGRPVEAKAWRMTASLAQQLIAAAAARPTPYVIDYDHQTLHIEKNGQPAPAAGWFHKLEWREGVGLFGVDVEWTAKASGMIDAKEYRFISPVIGFAANGDVTGLFMAALTNNPAILGMDEVLTAAASMQFASLNASITQESPMSLLEKLIALLKLPAESTDDDVAAAIQKLIDAKDPDAAKPDPAKFVPVAALTALHGQVASLNAKLNTQSLDSVIQNGLDSHRLLPSMVDWAREFGAKDTAALSAYIATLPVVVALNGTQTNGQPQKTNVAGLTESQVALCAAMGVSEKDYMATLAAENRT